MSTEAKKTIETIKSGQLPKIEIEAPKEQSGMDVSQRGLDVLNYGLSSNKKKD